MENKKYNIFRILYYVLVVLVLIQAAFFGFDEYILLPVLCLIMCYYKMKQYQENNEQ